MVLASTRDASGCLPLHLAAKTGNVEQILACLHNNAEDINATSNVGATPLVYAAQGGHLEAVRLLLQRGANRHVKTRKEKTALMVATEKRHSAVAQLLQNDEKPAVNGASTSMKVGAAPATSASLAFNFSGNNFQGPAPLFGAKVLSTNNSSALNHAAPASALAATPEKATPSTLFSLPSPPDDSVSSIASSMSGELLAAASWDCTVRTWKISTSEAESELVLKYDHSKPALCVSIRSEIPQIVSGGADGAVRSVNLQIAGSDLNIVGEHKAPVSAVCTHNSTVITSSWDCSICCWDLRLANAKPCISTALPERILSLCVSWPNALVGMSSPGGITSIDFRCVEPIPDQAPLVSDLSGSILQSVRRYPPRCVAFMPGNQRFCVGTYDGIVGVHCMKASLADTNFEFTCHRVGKVAYPIHALHFRKSQANILATGGGDGSAYLWDVQTGKKLEQLCDSSPGLAVTALTFGGDRDEVFAFARSYDWAQGAERLDKGSQVFVKTNS